MKITDWIQGKKLNFETMEIKEQNDLVIIPAWQFVLLIEKLKEYRLSMLSYLLLVVVLAGLLILGVYLP